MSITITPSIVQPTLTADALFAPGGGNIAVECWETNLLILRGHLTASEATEVLAGSAPWWPSQTRLIPGAIKHTWTRFTWHEDDCPETEPGQLCDCTDTDNGGPEWIGHPADRLTRGALPVTRAYVYTPPPDEAELLADARNGIHMLTVGPDYSRPEEHEPFVASLREHNWFDDSSSPGR